MPVVGALPAEQFRAAGQPGGRGNHQPEGHPRRMGQGNGQKTNFMQKKKKKINRLTDLRQIKWKNPRLPVNCARSPPAQRDRLAGRPRGVAGAGAAGGQGRGGGQGPPQEDLRTAHLGSLSWSQGAQPTTHS